MVRRRAETRAPGLFVTVAVVAMLAGLAGCGDGSGEPPDATASQPSIATTGTATADLDRWLERLEAVHPEPFHAVDRDEFVAVAVGGHPIDDVLAALEPLVPRDGPATVPTFRPGLLLRTVVLRGLGLMPDVDEASIALTFESVDGERTVDVVPITLDEHIAWAGPYGRLRLPSLDGVGYLAISDTPLTWTYLDAERTLYVRETEVRPGGTAVGEIRERAQQADVDRLVLDIRQNPGGDNHNNPPIVDILVSLEANRPDVAIVVITDRVTFSAASNLATDIDQATEAVFVGEAMGGGLNFWDDVEFLELDALPVPMMVGISTRYWERAEPDDPRLTIEPDIAVPVTWADLARGTDPALDAALAVMP